MFLRFLLSKGILNEPRIIFNVDKTGFGKSQNKEKVFAEKARKHTCSFMYTKYLNQKSYTM